MIFNTSRRTHAGFGIQTAAVAAGGFVTGALANVEEWDGTSWTEVNNVPSATNDTFGAGTLT